MLFKHFRMSWRTFFELLNMLPQLQKLYPARRKIGNRPEVDWHFVFRTASVTFHVTQAINKIWNNSLCRTEKKKCRNAAGERGFRRPSISPWTATRPFPNVHETRTRRDPCTSVHESSWRAKVFGSTEAATWRV